MTPLTNPLPFFFVVATVFGVLMHDTQADHAAAVAINNPTATTNFASSEVVSRTNDQHVHVEKVSVSGSGNAGTTRVNPHTQARDDDRRYVQAKKSIYSGGDSQGLWPSS
jgi:hypothetical protein